jgi:hypothetical protein
MVGDSDGKSSDAYDVSTCRRHARRTSSGLARLLLLHGALFTADLLVTLGRLIYKL